MSSNIRFDVVSLLPELVQSVVAEGVTGRAHNRGLIDLEVWNPREFTHDVHRTVDDRPYGGGPGMVMKYEPLRDAITAAKAADSRPAKVIYLSPQGRTLDQQGAIELAQAERLILLCGRYEGVDERVIDTFVDEEWSIGDYVLSGGELAAMVIMDAVTRLIPGALGDAESAQQDSYMDGLLDCPHYTRPEQIEGQSVPKVLLGGNHAVIAEWRAEQALKRTWQRRPDLLEGRELTDEQARQLAQYRREAETN